MNYSRDSLEDPLEDLGMVSQQLEQLSVIGKQLKRGILKGFIGTGGARICSLYLVTNLPFYPN